MVGGWVGPAPPPPPSGAECGRGVCVCEEDREGKWESDREIERFDSGAQSLGRSVKELERWGRRTGERLRERLRMIESSAWETGRDGRGIGRGGGGGGTGVKFRRRSAEIP